jgi:fructose-specific component phosphotransferase system IIB-like protein
MSRSALAQRTGLNRSTISDLVTELEDLGLITESDTSDRTGVGRPSRMVALAEDVVVFAVNPEADATTVGMVTLSGQVIRKERITMATVPEPSEAVEVAGNAIATMRREAGRNFRVVGIGVAADRPHAGLGRAAEHAAGFEGLAGERKTAAGAGHKGSPRSGVRSCQPPDEEGR